MPGAAGTTAGFAPTIFRESKRHSKTHKVPEAGTHAFMEMLQTRYGPRLQAQGHAIADVTAVQRSCTKIVQAFLKIKDRWDVALQKKVPDALVQGLFQPLVIADKQVRSRC